MTIPLDAALDYAARGWPIFPCHWAGERRKRPLIEDWPRVASRESDQVAAWWREWPQALIGLPTGEPIGAVVLDLDVKDPARNGWDALDDLGYSLVDDTPMVHTASGGLHLYFERPAGGLRNTTGARGRGIGPGLDWRGDGGFVIVPSPDSGYAWDPHWAFETVVPAPVPPILLPRESERHAVQQPVKPVDGLSPYARSALDSACRRIIDAPDGQQESTLNAEAFAIGTLAGASAIPAEFARRTLLWAGSQIRTYDARHPWRADQIAEKIGRAFADGEAQPREGRP